MLPADNLGIRPSPLFSPFCLQEVTESRRSAFEVPLPTLVIDVKGKETSVGRHPTTCQAWDILFPSLNLSAGNDHLVPDTYDNVDFSSDLLTGWMRSGEWPTRQLATVGAGTGCELCGVLLALCCSPEL